MTDVPEIRKVCVLGAGNMGSGIAQACAAGGLEVTVRDLKEDFLAKSRERIEKPLRKRVDAGKQSKESVDAIMANLSWTTDLADAARDADLIIEAVFEDLDVKKSVFAEASQVAPAHAVFATNTSSLSVTELAKATDRPDRMGGLHFFFPAAINKLVEVVAGDDTDPAVVDALEAFSRRIRKIPIRTADAYGFAVNRFFVPWVNEAVRLLDEGVADVPTIDAAAKKGFGITMGPFELMNVTGVPISLHAQRTLHKGFGEFYEPSPRLVKQVEEVKADWDLSGEPDESRFDAVNERLLGVTFGIAARLAEEGVATPRDTDKGALVGLRWAKGPFRMMNDTGSRRALELVRAVNAKWGDAFPVAKELERLGESDGAWTLPLVRLEKDGHVAVVTVDRPEAMNALNPDVLRDLDETMARAFEDEDVRAIVLTGEGGKAFVAGADIKFMADKQPVDARRFTLQGQQVMRRLETGGKPVIAAVNGFAFGGGLELALACDVVLASDNATFGLPEVTLGIHPGFGGTQRLPRVVGLQRARELIYTGRRFGAAEAKDMGLVLAVHPQDALTKEALKLAQSIAGNAPVAIQLAKASINRGTETDIETGLAYELEAVSLTFSTEDQKNAMRAFMERRAPEFKGR